MFSNPLFRGEPERAPNTRETGSGVYIFIYLFVRDLELAGQRLNAHAQTPRGRSYTVTGKGRHQCRSKESQCSVASYPGSNF